MVKEKECEACGVFFIASRSNVKYCPNCSPHSVHVKRRIEKQMQKNIQKYGCNSKDSKRK